MKFAFHFDEFSLPGKFIRYGLVVRIAGSHPAGLGSIPGNGMIVLFPLFYREIMSKTFLTGIVVTC